MTNSGLIEINLSPGLKQRQKKKTPRTRTSNAIGIAISALLLCVAVFYVFVFVREHRLKRIKANFEQLKTPYSEVEKYRELHDRLAEKKRVLEACRTRWVRWSDQWLELARLTPETVYLVCIELSNADKRGDSQRLTLRGRAAGAAGESVVLHFLEQLKRSSLFTNAFSSMTLSAVYTEGDEKVFSIELMRNGLSDKQP